jgi:glycosyltransferase involved in cell wall biosynthesis
MKIIHLILTRRFAGSERYAVELANMQAAEHDVSIILQRNAGEARADAVAGHISSRVNVIYVSNFRPLALWQARRAIKRLRPDVSHAHLSWGCRVLSGMSEEAGVRVATLHITYKPKQHYKLDGLIAIAPWQLPLLPDRFRQRSTHIDNWSYPKAPSENARQRLRQAYGIEEDALVFGTLGRLDESKGLDVVISAFHRAAMPNAKLVVVGDGKTRSQLQQNAGADVIFPGYTSEPQDWLAAFDVFVNAARSEPFGLVFLEAMHAGLPIIASASQGATHLAPYIGRPLVAIDDVQGFAEAFTHIASEPPRRQSYDLQRFDPHDRGADVLKFYQRLMMYSAKG